MLTPPVFAEGWFLGLGGSVTFGTPVGSMSTMTASATSLHTKDGAGGAVSGGYEFGDGVRVENELS